MTHETEMELKHGFYADAKKKAAMCMTAMGAKPKDGVAPDSWEGVMTMLEDVFKRGTDADKSAAVLAAAKWIWAHMECEAEKVVEGAEDMIAREVEAAKKSSADDEPTENGGADEKPVTEAAPAAVTPEAVMK